MGKQKTLQKAVWMAFILGLALGGNVWGQGGRDKEWNYRGEVFGGIGMSRFYHGDYHLGDGIDWSAGAGVRPFTGSLRGLGFEICANGFNFDRSWGDGYSNQGDALAISGNALYHFGRSSTQFYVLGGLGALHADYQFINPYTRELYGDPDYVERHNATQFAVNLGLGVKARISSNLSIRPELRLVDTTAGSGYNWGDLHLSIGLSYHF